MKKLVVPALLVAGLTLSVLVGATSVSWAQETAPSCAQAISTFLDARVAFEKLPKKVDNPELVDLAKAVEGATKTRDERRTALTAARLTADTTDTVVVADDRSSVRDRIRAIEDHIAKNTTTPEDAARHKNVILPTRQAELRAIDTLASAQSDLDAKTTAHQNAPRRVDNPALKAGKEFDALVKTQTAADNACEGQPNDPGPVNPTPTTTPAPTTAPAPVVNNNTVTDSGFEQVGTVPQGGVDTGGGPA